MSGDKCCGSVRKAMPEKSAVVVNTLRRPLTSAPPKSGSIFLGDLPRDDFANVRACGTRNVLRDIGAFPRLDLFPGSADPKRIHILRGAVFGLPGTSFGI